MKRTARSVVPVVPVVPVVTVVTVAALGLLSACAAGSSGGGDAVRDPVGPRDAPVLADGADDVVLRIETGGGYVPVEYAFTGVPTVLVTGDGTVVQPAPRAADAAQPSLLPLVRHTVDGRELQEVARLAEDAGLLAEPPDYQAGAPQVTDMPSTTVTFTVDGATWVHSAYALGFEEEDGARRVLADFVDDAQEVLGDGAEPYRPTALRLRATESMGAAPEGPAAPWPATAPALAGVGGCAVVDDPAAVAAVTAALSDQATDGVLTDAGRTFIVAAAAVLPGDSRPCADW